MTPPTPQNPIEPTSANPLIAALDGVTKIYGKDDIQVTALNNVSLQFRRGEFTAIMGPSGSGKSTMLHVLAGLDTLSSGQVVVDGSNLGQMNDTTLTRFRRDRIGFVFQAFNLIPTITVKANIELPLRLAGKKVDSTWFDQVVHALNLQERLVHKPYQLSGGQQQRVAVARALITRPALLVADEPTGNLDSSSTTEVLGLLRAAVDQLGQTVIMVTHDRRAAGYADRVLVVRDGAITADLLHPSETKIAEVA